MSDMTKTKKTKNCASYFLLN